MGASDDGHEFFLWRGHCLFGTFLVGGAASNQRSKMNPANFVKLDVNDFSIFGGTNRFFLGESGFD